MRFVLTIMFAVLGCSQVRSDLKFRKATISGVVTSLTSKGRGYVNLEVLTGGRVENYSLSIEAEINEKVLEVGDSIRKRPNEREFTVIKKNTKEVIRLYRN